jgi:putative transposase
MTGAALHGGALGDAGFVAELQKKTDRRVSESRPGRPISRSGSPGEI